MQDLSSIQQPFMGNIEALRGRNDPEAVKAVAKEMESLFVYEMLKVMREASGTSSTGGLGSDTYTSMFDMELSKVIAERGLGLSDMLTKDLSAIAEKTTTPSKNSGSDRDLKKAGTEEIRGLLPEVDHPRVSSGYGLRRDPFSGELKFHHGLDIAAPEGTEVHPVKAGTVQFSGEQPKYGNVVIIDHGDGFTSTYAHNKVNLVQAGEKVDSKTVIARVGSTGRSTGPHIHFEVAYKGEKVDPGKLLAMR